MKTPLLVILLVSSFLLFGCTGDKVLLLGDTLVDVNALKLDGNTGQIPMVKDKNTFVFYYDLNYNNQSGVLYALEFGGDVNWNKLKNYPASCGPGKAVQSIGDTLTCVSIGGSSGGDSNFNKYDNNSPGGVFIGLSSGTTDGSISYGGKTGYAAAHDMCYVDYNGHMCTPDEIILTIYLKGLDGYVTGNTAWVANGPNSYTANSNDCLGFSNNTNTFLGEFWIFDSASGGAGWATNCSQVKKVACCR